MDALRAAVLCSAFGVLCGCSENALGDPGFTDGPEPFDAYDADVEPASDGGVDWAWDEGIAGELTDEPSTPSEPRLPVRYYLPFDCGFTAYVSQGNHGSTSHRGLSAYAYDFSIPSGTRLRAMADGRVVRTYKRTGPGDPCYDGGGPSCVTRANYVHVRHADGKLTIYVHMRHVRVSRGDRVRRGDVLGRSGSTGYSTGPHAHVARTRDCGERACQTVKLRFQDVRRNDGVPRTGWRVTSRNCPEP